jgi:hypothetical protein
LSGKISPSIIAREKLGGKYKVAESSYYVIQSFQNYFEFLNSVCIKLLFLTVNAWL